MTRPVKLETAAVGFAQVFVERRFGMGAVVANHVAGTDSRAGGCNVMLLRLLLAPIIVVIPIIIYGARLIPLARRATSWARPADPSRWRSRSGDRP